MAEIKLTNQNFATEVIKSNIPVLVDFWAEWCGPCKMLSPIMSEIAKEYEGKIKVGKVNVDEEPFITEQFWINSIPTVLLFKEGKVAASNLGYVTKEEIIKMLK